MPRGLCASGHLCFVDGRTGLCAGLCALIPADAVFFCPADEALLLEVVEVGDGFSHGELALVGVGDVAFEEGRHDAAGGLRCLAEFEDEVTAVFVVDFEEVDAFVDADEWASMGWQDEGVFWQSAEFLQGVEKVFKRVALRECG